MSEQEPQKKPEDNLIGAAYILPDPDPQLSVTLNDIIDEGFHMAHKTRPALTREDYIGNLTAETISALATLFNPPKI